MRFLIITLIAVLLYGCQDIEKSPRPDNLIPESKMVDVLTEMSLLHGARSYNKNLLEEKGIKPKEYLYEKYGIDSLQFVESNQYYSENYKQYHDIYTRVKERLMVLKEEYDSIRDVEEQRIDSLRTLRDSVQQDSLEIQEDSLRIRKRPGSEENQLLPPAFSQDSVPS